MIMTNSSGTVWLLDDGSKTNLTGINHKRTHILMGHSGDFQTVCLEMYLLDWQISKPISVCQLLPFTFLREDYIIYIYI